MIDKLELENILEQLVKISFKVEINTNLSSSIEDAICDVRNAIDEIDDILAWKEEIE